MNLPETNAQSDTQPVPTSSCPPSVAFVRPSPPRNLWGSCAHNGAAALVRPGCSGRPQPSARRRGPAASRPRCVPHCPCTSIMGSSGGFPANLPLPAVGPRERRGLGPGRHCRARVPLPHSPFSASRRPAWGGGLTAGASADRAAIVTFPRRAGTQPSVYHQR